MRADFKVVLDACVLANAGLCDLFLRLAEPPRLYLPLWSNEILEEVKRTQVTKLRNPYPPDLAAYWHEQVTKAFPEAAVPCYEMLLPAMANNEKDRHVLAAAVKGGAALIITFNLKHFPSDALQPWGVAAAHPQDYLLTLYSMSPAVVMGKLSAIAQDRHRDLQDVLIHLGKSVPAFAARLLEDLGPAPP